jgi:hypothetical protein
MSSSRKTSMNKVSYVAALLPAPAIARDLQINAVETFLRLLSSGILLLCGAPPIT